MVVVYGYIQTRCLMIVTRQHVHGGDSQNTDPRILKTPVNSTCCHEISRRTLLEMPIPADCSSGTSVRRIELDRSHPWRRLHVRLRYGRGEPQTQKPKAGGFPAQRKIKCACRACAPLGGRGSRRAVRQCSVFSAQCSVIAKPARWELRSPEDRSQHLGRCSLRLRTGFRVEPFFWAAE